jgi:hypothetical protein
MAADDFRRRAISESRSSSSARFHTDPSVGQRPCDWLGFRMRQGGHLVGFSIVDLEAVAIMPHCKRMRKDALFSIKGRAKRVFEFQSIV